MAIDGRSSCCKYQGTNSSLKGKNLQRVSHCLSLYSFPPRCLLVDRTIRSWQLVFSLYRVIACRSSCCKYHGTSSLLKEKNLEKLPHYLSIYYFSPRCLSLDRTMKSSELIFLPKMAIRAGHLCCKYHATNSFLNEKNPETLSHCRSLNYFPPRYLLLERTTKSWELIFSP